MRYTDDTLIFALKFLTYKLGHVPTTKEVRESKGLIPPVSTYERHFKNAKEGMGGWKAAQIIAGSIPTEAEKTYPEVTNEKLLDDLRRKALQEGRTPTKKMVDEDPTMYNSSMYISRFKSWNRAIKLAGLKPNKCGFPKALSRQHFTRP